MEAENTPPKPRTPRDVLILRAVLGIVGAFVVATALWLAYAYAVSPEPIRHPASDHLHLRLQVINNGRPVNFADAKFQTSDAGVCTVALTADPIHFHDGKDQFAHIHWAKITGGLLLKDYGWNFIGGPDVTLGYKLSGGFKLPQRVPIHGQALPAPSKDAKYYVYTGDAAAYRQRSWSDFLQQDLATFMAGSPIGATLLGRLIPPAFADSEETPAKLNHVIGNIVIFAQKDPPSSAQIRDRFQHLVPIPTSQCSG